MKHWFTILIYLVFSYSLQAQIIDDSSVQNAEQGYQFVEGRFVAFLADTTTPEFVNKTFDQFNITVLSMEIEPVIISLVNVPSDEILASLKAHPQVKMIYKTKSADELRTMNLYLESSNLTGVQKQEIRNNAMQVETFLIEFEYPVGTAQLKKIMGEFRGVAYKILQTPERTVTLQAEIGKEPLLMDKVNELSFVKGTAMVGEIGN